jgi:3-deoxy-manno-octulosonate cytidylyltransferase (CMP-KDO synthetase)
MDSKRLPGKVMADVNGKSVLQRTFERASKAQQPFTTVIAVDQSPELLQHAKSFAKHVWPTPNTCRCGTYRVAYMARHQALSKADIVVNVQADEIDIDPKLIDELIQKLADDVSLDMATAVIKRSKDHKPRTNSTVQAVIDEDGKLQDLVRYEGGPVDKDYFEHIGIAAFRKEALFKYMSYDPSDRDRAQNNEYLTAIDKGFRIATVTYEGELTAINTQEDLDALTKPKPEPAKRKPTKKLTRVRKKVK